MKTFSLRTLTLTLVLILVISIFTVSVPAKEGTELTPDQRIEELIRGIREYKKNTVPGGDIPDWLAVGAGVDTDWYAVAFARSLPSEEVSAYASALLTAAAREGGNIGAVERQRRIIALLACGVTDEEGKYDVFRFIGKEVSETTGKQGVMSLIWGIQILNYHAPDSEARKDATDKLLALEISGGGWAVSGSAANPDVTAMAIQALAAQYGDNVKVRTAVDAGLKYLSDAQLDGGGYRSYGAVNAESAAQVIIALTALGKDPLAEEGFIKDGANLLDVLERYRLPSGGVAHVEGGEANETATAQAMCALVALARQRQGVPGLYSFTDSVSRPLPFPGNGVSDSGGNGGNVGNGGNTGNTGNTGNNGNNAGGNSSSDPSSSGQNGSEGDAMGKTLWQKLRLPISILIVVVGAAVILAYQRRGRLTRERLIMILGTAAVLIVILWLVNIETVEEYRSRNDEPSGSAATGSVTVTIRISEEARDAVAGKAETDMGADGEFCSKITVAIGEDQTVSEVLETVCRREGIALDRSGAGRSVYVRGIGGVYEFDGGSGSGWVYTVNGKSPNVSCGTFAVSPGDEIVWEYVTSVSALR